MASDGLWDTISCSNAIHGAMQAREQQTNPAEYLVDMGLRGLQARGSSDNVRFYIMEHRVYGKHCSDCYSDFFYWLIPLLMCCIEL